MTECPFCKKISDDISKHKCEMTKAEIGLLIFISLMVIMVVVLPMLLV